MEVKFMDGRASKIHLDNETTLVSSLDQRPWKSYGNHVLYLEAT